MLSCPLAAAYDRPTAAVVGDRAPEAAPARSGCPRCLRSLQPLGCVDPKRLRISSKCYISIVCVCPMTRHVRATCMCKRPSGRGPSSKKQVCHLVQQSPLACSISATLAIVRQIGSVGHFSSARQCLSIQAYMEPADASNSLRNASSWTICKTLLRMSTLAPAPGCCRRHHLPMFQA